ncbi:MAG: copper transporter, partial [Thermoleophilaceae bacterium]|nr:copper transporter [Thermoleophilaceae bacterium]
MFDFRYHALSLVAVFLALGIGIVLGATIGDSLVSSADKSLRSSLRSDVVAARKAARDARAELSRRDRLIDAAMPYIVSGRLLGERVALVSTGGLPSELEKNVTSAVSAAGGTIDSTSELSVPGQSSDIAQALGATLADDTDTAALNRLGRRVARLLVRGGRGAAAGHPPPRPPGRG